MSFKIPETGDCFVPVLYFSHDGTQALHMWCKKVSSIHQVFPFHTTNCEASVFYSWEMAYAESQLK